MTDLSSTGQEHPITPPTELIRKWDEEAAIAPMVYQHCIATQAARWGYQQAVEELETFLKKGNDKR